MQKHAALLLIKATTTVNAMRIQMLYANGATLRSLCTSPTFLPTLRNSGSNALRPRMRKFQVGLGQPLQPLPDRWMFCVSLLIQKLHRPQLRIWGVAFRFVLPGILESHHKATEGKTLNLFPVHLSAISDSALVRIVLGNCIISVE